MEFKRGTIKSFDTGIYKAIIQIEGSLPAWLDGITVARNIGSADMVAGRKCAVMFFDEANPEDAVLVAVYE